MPDPSKDQIHAHDRHVGRGSGGSGERREAGRVTQTRGTSAAAAAAALICGSIFRDPTHMAKRHGLYCYTHSSMSRTERNDNIYLYRIEEKIP